MSLLDEIRAAHGRALAGPDALDLGDDRMLVFKEPLTLKFEPFAPPSTHETPADFPLLRSTAGVAVYRPTPFKILPARHVDVFSRSQPSRCNLARVTVRVEPPLTQGRANLHPLPADSRTPRHRRLSQRPRRGHLRRGARLLAPPVLTPHGLRGPALRGALADRPPRRLASPRVRRLSHPRARRLRPIRFAPADQPQEEARALQGAAA